MGHLRVGELPKTRAWQSVVGLLDEHPEDVASVASATVKAAREELERLKREPTLAYCFWLLTRITWNARQQGFSDRLAELGVDLAGSSSAISFISAVSDHARLQSASLGGSSVFREIANLALKQALTDTVAVSTPTLFGSTLENVQEACRKYSSKAQFGNLSRRFFSIFFTRFLGYFTNKELSSHIGPGKKIATIDEGRDFNDALATYAWQSSKIVEDFAAGWYSKHNWQSEGDITKEDAQKFVAYALKKLQMELSQEEKQDE